VIVSFDKGIQHVSGSRLSKSEATRLP
jgi:hypothetical protein